MSYAPRREQVPAIAEERKAATSDSTAISETEEAATAHGWTSMKTLRMARMKKKKKRDGDLASGDNAEGPQSSEERDGKGRFESRAEALGSSSAADEAFNEMRSDDELLEAEDRQVGGSGTADIRELNGRNGIVYKVYKRRWFGLVQLVLLNVVVSWDWLSFSAISTTSAQYFETTPAVINWLSTAFLFAFVVASPAVIYTLHRGGPKSAIIVASVLLLVGNWIRYGATRSKNYGAVMFGQILTGLAQPFVLAAPTRYSDLWFTGGGRVAATAVMSLANPLGGALGQLIDPFWADQPGQVPDMVLYIAIIATVATIPSFFIPAHPPTPCSPSSNDIKQGIMASIKALVRSPEFYMIAIPYAVLVGFFNSISSLINQILEPYGFTETDAGIAGALLIVVGLIAAAISSPLIDRSKRFLLAIKVQVPIIAICYLVFIWAPPTGSLAAVCVILSILGAASFSLVPIVLEYLCEITHPISPEVTSTICWTGGQFLGAIFIIVSGPLTDGPAGGSGDKVPYNMQRVLWFQAIIALLVVPLPLCLGLFGRRSYVKMRRAEADKASIRTASTYIETAGASV